MADLAALTRAENGCRQVTRSRFSRVGARPCARQRQLIAEP